MLKGKWRKKGEAEAPPISLYKYNTFRPQKQEVLKPKKGFGCGKNGKEYDYNSLPLLIRIWWNKRTARATLHCFFGGGVGHMSRHAPSSSDKTTSQRSQNRLNPLYGSPPDLPFVSWILYAESCQERGERIILLHQWLYLWRPMYLWRSFLPV